MPYPDLSNPAYVYETDTEQELSMFGSHTNCTICGKEIPLAELELVGIQIVCSDCKAAKNRLKERER